MLPKKIPQNFNNIAIPVCFFCPLFCVLRIVCSLGGGTCTHNTGQKHVNKPQQNEKKIHQTTRTKMEERDLSKLHCKY